MRDCTRRRALGVGGLALLGSFAGCAAFQTDSANAEDLSFERLATTAVYVADSVDLSMPAEIETVNATHNADLLILPGDTSADGQRAVEWFADGRVVALLGDSSEATWLSWARSDAFRDAFKNEGYGDAEPDPSLVVGATVGLYVQTYRHSWPDGPRNRDVLRALDESLVAIAEERPPA